MTVPEREIFDLLVAGEWLGIKELIDIGTTEFSMRNKSNSNKLPLNHHLRKLWQKLSTQMNMGNNCELVVDVDNLLTENESSSEASRSLTQCSSQKEQVDSNQTLPNTTNADGIGQDIKEEPVDVDLPETENELTSTSNGSVLPDTTSRNTNSAEQQNNPTCILDSLVSLPTNAKTVESSNIEKENRRPSNHKEKLDSVQTDDEGSQELDFSEISSYNLDQAVFDEIIEEYNFEETNDDSVNNKKSSYNSHSTSEVNDFEGWENQASSPIKTKISSLLHIVEEEVIL